LFGFQFESAFQERFAELLPRARAGLAASLVLLVLSVGMLIAPSLHHQIRFRGESRRAALRVATFFAGWSLLPLTLGLGVSAYVVFSLLFGSAVGVATGAAFTVTSLLLLCGWGFFLREIHYVGPLMKEEQPTELKTKIEQLLTEARVIIPGGQALLGFQFIATLTKAFADLPHAVQIIHAAGLCAVALAVTLLMTPAALHRIAFHGEDSARFYRIASRVVIAATVPLAAGTAADVGVVFWRVTEGAAAAVIAGAATFAVLIAMWLAYPFNRRARVSCASN
jgi:hypothetical protein